MKISRELSNIYRQIIYYLLVNKISYKEWLTIYEFLLISIKKEVIDSKCAIDLINALKRTRVILKSYEEDAVIKQKLTELDSILINILVNILINIFGNNIKKVR